MPLFELLSEEGIITLVLLALFCLVVIAAGVIHVVFRGGKYFADSVKENYVRREKETKKKETKELPEEKDWHEGVEVVRPIGLDPIYLYEEGEWVVSKHLKANVKLDEHKNLYIADLFAAMEDIEKTNTFNVFKVRASNGAPIELAVKHLKEQILRNDFFQKDVAQLKDFEGELNHYNRYKNCIQKVEGKYWFVLLEVDETPPINTLTKGV